LKNPTHWGCTYLYSQYKGVPPPQTGFPPQKRLTEIPRGREISKPLALLLAICLKFGYFIGGKYCSWYQMDKKKNWTLFPLVGSRWVNFILGDIWHPNMPQAMTCQSNSFPSDPSIHSLSPYYYSNPV